MVNVDAAELNKFSEVAHKWWDKHSEFKPLHEINPLRLNYIDQAHKHKPNAIWDQNKVGLLNRLV